MTMLLNTLLPPVIPKTYSKVYQYVLRMYWKRTFVGLYCNFCYHNLEICLVLELQVRFLSIFSLSIRMSSHKFLKENADLCTDIAYIHHLWFGGGVLIYLSACVNTIIASVAYQRMGTLYFSLNFSTLKN